MRVVGVTVLALLTSAFSGSDVGAQGIDRQLTGRTFAREEGVELGGGPTLVLADEFRMFGATLSAGWFVRDDLELSTVFGLTSFELDDNEQTLFSALVEPAYHLALSRAVHAFAGVGLGTVFVGDLGPGIGVAPRIGVKLRVGDSGLLVPAIAYQHVFNNVEDEMMDTGVDAALDSLRVDLGYATFW